MIHEVIIFIEFDKFLHPQSLANRAIDWDISIIPVLSNFSLQKR